MTKDEKTGGKAPGRLRMEEAGGETEGHGKPIRRVQPAGEDDDTEGHGKPIRR